MEETLDRKPGDANPGPDSVIVVLTPLVVI